LFYDVTIIDEFKFVKQQAVCAHYVHQPNRGYDACERLLYSPNQRPSGVNYMRFYIGSLPTEGTPICLGKDKQCNPSVCLGSNGQIFVSLRKVKDSILTDGSYEMGCDGNVVKTWNRVMIFSSVQELFENQVPMEILEVPAGFDDDTTKAGNILGFEDLRLVYDGQQLHALATCRQTNPAHENEIVLLSNILPGGDDFQVYRLTKNKKCEKNWVPWKPFSQDIRFVYNHESYFLFDQENKSVTFQPAPQHIYSEEPFLKNIRGSSQLVCVDLDTYYQIVHEVFLHPNTPGRRIYYHRWIVRNEEFQIIGYSDLFYFRQKQGIEFCAGLEYIPSDDMFLISFGVEDKEAWIVKSFRRDIIIHTLSK
jgi:hypothetical protein